MSRCSRKAVRTTPATVARQKRTYTMDPSARASTCWSAKTAFISRPKCSRNSRGSSNSRKENTRCERRGLFAAEAINTSGVLGPDDLLGTGHRQYAFEAFGFGFGHLVSQFRQAVIAATFIIESELGPMFGLFDELVLQQPLNDPVQ